MDFNEAYELTYKAIERMTRRKDPDFTYLANYWIKHLTDTATSSEIEATTVKDYLTANNNLVYWLRFINKSNDLSIDNWEINIKHVFWMTVFFDSLMEKYKNKASIESYGSKYSLTKCFILFSKGRSNNIILAFTYSTADDDFCSFIFNFPRWDTNNTETNKLKLEIEQWGTLHKTEWTASLSEISFKKLPHA